jgi:hypothetical protein
MLYKLIFAALAAAQLALAAPVPGPEAMETREATAAPEEVSKSNTILSCPLLNDVSRASTPTMPLQRTRERKAFTSTILLRTRERRASMTIMFPRIRERKAFTSTILPRTRERKVSIPTMSYPRRREKKVSTPTMLHQLQRRRNARTLKTKLRGSRC